MIMTFYDATDIQGISNILLYFKMLVFKNDICSAWLNFVICPIVSLTFF